MYYIYAEYCINVYGMCSIVDIYIFACANIHTNASICASSNICICYCASDYVKVGNSMCVCMWLSVYASVNVYLCIYVFMSKYSCLCILCVYTCVRVYMYMYLHRAECTFPVRLSIKTDECGKAASLAVSTL